MEKYLYIMIQCNLIVIRTNKLHEQAQFYTALGFEFEYHQHGNGPMHYASKGTQPTLEIYPLLKSQIKPDVSTRLGFLVENPDIIVQSVLSLGGNLVTQGADTPWGYTAVIADLDGRKIELVQSKTPAR
jgi:predicted lactoylglutathione lyase